MMDTDNLKAYRPVVFWSWNDRLENENIVHQFDELDCVGIGGGFLHSRVGLVTEYLSSAWMECVQCACDHAEKIGSSVWLYDEDRFPSGYAGGKVLEQNDNLRAKALCLIEKSRSEEFRIIKIYEKLLRTGKEYLIALCDAPDGNPNFEGKSYVDLLNPETVKCFIQTTHEQYRRAVGKYFGKIVKGVFSDEFCYTQKAAFHCPTVPFTVDLEKDFRDAVGYDLTNRMAELFFDEGDYHTLRRDFYAFLTKRFINSFTKPYNEWCNQNGLQFTGHLLNEDFLTSQTEWIGAAMPHYLHMGMPGVDKLGSDPNYLLTVKQLTSVAEEFGTRALCEAFACSGHQFGPGEIKRVSDWLCSLGINFINPHLTQYSMRGERKRDCPPDLSVRQPWFPESRECFDHITRVCALSDGSCPQPTVLVIHPIQSVWAEYSPLHKPNRVFSIWSDKNPFAGQNFVREVESYEKPFFDLSHKLCANGIYYHYGDEMILEEYAKVDENGLTVGNCTYRAVVVPPVMLLRESTKKLLRDYVTKFGDLNLFFIGDNDFGIGGVTVPDVDTAVKALDERLQGRITVRDVFTNHPAGEIYFRENRKNGKRSCFFANISQERGYRVKITLPIDFVPIVYDTVTDSKYQAVGALTKNGFVMRADFKIGGSLMILEEPAENLPNPLLLQSGVVFPNDRVCLTQTAYPKGTVQGSNVLPLDTVDYRVREKAYHNTPLEFLWHGSFFKLPDGTPFEADYHFCVMDIPNGETVAFVEMAENLDAVIFNGEPLQSIRIENCPPCFRGCYTAFLLKNIRNGDNVLTIRGEKCNNINGVGSHLRVSSDVVHRPTELETVFLYGDFSVAEQNAGEYVLTKPQKNVVGSITHCGLPFYSGVLHYSLRAVSESNLISLDADAASAALYVNGIKKGVSFVKPFSFALADALRESDRVEILLYGSLVNTFGPLHLACRDRLSMVGPVYFVDPNRYVKQPILFDFGLKSVQWIKQKN